MSSALQLSQGEYPRWRRVAQALCVLWVLALADLALTIWAHLFTPFIELNPLADQVLQFGFPALILFKFISTGIGTTIFWRLRNHARSECMLWGLVIVYVLLAIRWADYTHGAMVNICRM